MTLLVSSLVVVTLLAALALGVVRGMRRRSAAQRHAVLAAVIVAALLAPAFELVLPTLPVLPATVSPATVSSTIAWQQEAVPSVRTVTASAGLTAAARPDWAFVLAALWALGALVMGGGLLVSLLRVSRLRRRCTPVRRGPWRHAVDALVAAGDVPQVELLAATASTPLVVCGIARPAIILPATAVDWPLDRIRAILLHELAHVRRRDALVGLAAEIVRVLHWCNPLVWQVCRHLRQESEFASDNEVLRAGVDRTEYAQHLLAVARDSPRPHATWASAPAIAHPSHLERRVSAMLFHQHERTPLTRRARTVSIVAMLLVAMPLAAIGTAPAPAGGAGAPLSSDTLLDASDHSTPGALPEQGSSTALSEAPARTPESPRVAAQRTPPRAPELPVAPAPAVAAPIASADDVLAALSGIVQDQTGGVVPGARVRLTDPSGTVRTTASDSNGQFLFRNIVPTQVELVISLPGFTSIHDIVTLRSGDNVTRVMTLPLATLQETITVDCSGAAVLPGAAIRFGGPSATAARPAKAAGLWAQLAQALFPTVSAQVLRPVRVGGHVQAPLKVTDVPPRCPADVPAGETIVTMIGRISADGMLTGVRAVRIGAGEFPPASLRESVEEALRGWTFTPARLNGQQTTVDLTVKVTFRTS